MEAVIEPTFEDVDFANAVWLGHPLSDRKARVLFVAQDLFARQGYRETEVKQIAEITGIGKATIYKIFKNKDGILQALLRELLNHLRDITISNFYAGDKISTSGDTLERIENIARDIFSFFEINKKLAKVFFVEGAEFGVQAHYQYQEIIETNMSLIEEFLRPAREKGELKALNDMHTVELILNTIFGISLSWVMSDKPSLVKHGTAYIRVLIKGLQMAGPDEETLAP